MMNHKKRMITTCRSSMFVLSVNEKIFHLHMMKIGSSFEFMSQETEQAA